MVPTAGNVAANESAPADDIGTMLNGPFPAGRQNSRTELGSSAIGIPACEMKTCAPTVRACDVLSRSKSGVCTMHTRPACDSSEQSTDPR